MTLAIGVIAPRALVVDGEVVARPACTLSCTFDHRVLDGAAVGRALTDLVGPAHDRRATGRLAAMKIVSLLPSATEIVYALGLGDALVGVTDECDFPPDAVTKPVVSRSALPQGRPLTSREIDAAVRERMDADQPLYVLDTDLLRREQPDVILTQDLCRVCAVPAGHVEEALDELGLTDARRCSRSTRSTLDDVIAQIEVVGALLGAEERGRRARGRTPRDRVAAVQADRGAPPDGERVLPRVGASRRSPPATGCPRWSRPSAPPTCSARRASPRGRVTHREIRDADARGARVHALRLLPGGGRGGGESRSSRTPRSPTRRRRATATCSRSTRRRSSRGPGPRIVDGLEILAWAVHPEAYPEPPPGTITRL